MPKHYASQVGNGKPVVDKPKKKKLDPDVFKVQRAVQDIKRRKKRHQDILKELDM